ncbi:MAG: cell division protein FtsA [Hyphomonadaceae bacterium]
MMALDLAPHRAAQAKSSPHRIERSKEVLAAVLDVGAAKTVCLAAPMSCTAPGQHGRALDLAGVGYQAAPATGQADFDACARAIRIAIDEAERGADAAIHEIISAYSGPGLSSRIIRGQARVRGQEVGVREAQAALAAAIHSAPAPGRAALHVAPLGYSIDGGAMTADPRGMQGNVLTVEACLVTAPAAAVQALRQCIRAAGVEPAEIVASPYAAALGAVSDDERAHGVLVIDMGAGGVGAAVISPEGLAYVDHIGLGGAKLTRALAKKLNAPFAAAERAKLLHGVVGGPYDPREVVETPTFGADGRLEGRMAPKSLFFEALGPRFQESLLSIRARLMEAGLSPSRQPQRAVLTGGGAQIPGAREIAQEALGLPTRIGRPIGLNDLDAGPAFSVSAGLLRWRLDRPPEASEPEEYEPSLREVGQAACQAASRAWSWLKENF